MAELTKTFARNVGPYSRILSAVAGSAVLYLNRNRNESSMWSNAVGTYLVLRGLTGYCLLFDALQKDKDDSKVHNVNIKTKIFVDRPRHEVYNFWRQLDNLPLFMKHLHKVTILNETQSEWSVDLPILPVHLKWKSEIVLDEVNDRIGWHSQPGSPVKNAGNVHFRDAGSGTEVNAIISYAPSGKITEDLGRLFSPMFKQMVIDDIRSFKQHIESINLQPGH